MPLALPKPPPVMLQRDAKRAVEIARDTFESAKVRARSKGRCEVTLGGVRCPKRAAEVHHHLGGWRRRGRGASALAINKTHACRDHHRQITGHVLVHVSGTRYRRREDGAR